MIAALLDTNVLVSGLVAADRADSGTGAVLAAWRSNRFKLVTGEPLLNELEAVLATSYLSRRVSPEQRRRLLVAIRRHARFVETVPPMPGVASHEADDAIVAIAIAGNADYLVTGDRELRALGQIQRVRCVTPREFLHVLDTAPGVVEAQLD